MWVELVCLTADRIFHSSSRAAATFLLLLYVQHVKAWYVVVERCITQKGILESAFMIMPYWKTDAWCCYLLILFGVRIIESLSSVFLKYNARCYAAIHSNEEISTLDWESARKTPHNLISRSLRYLQIPSDYHLALLTPDSHMIPREVQNHVLSQILEA